MITEFVHPGAAGAKLADVDTSIFYRAGQPLRQNTAWKIANAYAKHTGITPEQAYQKLIAEATDDP